MSIPRRFIQIYVREASSGLPPLAKAAMTNLRLLHPDWEHLFFDDLEVSRFMASESPLHQSVFNGFRYPIQRFDFFRYLAIFRLGGFYFDLDVLLSRPISDLTCYEAVFPFEELTLSRYLRRQYGMDWEIGNYGFGAVAGHPLIKAIIQNCVRAQREPNWIEPMMQGIPRFFRSWFYVLNTTGPGLVSRTLAENLDLVPDVTILFPDDVCDERNWHQFGNFGVHVQGASWRSKDGYFRRRLANLWQSWARRRVLRESRARGKSRSIPRSSTLGCQSSVTSFTPIR